MDKRIGFVFIHGAGLNRSVWADLIKEIKNPSLVIEFPNRKTDGVLNKTLSFDDYVDTAISQIENWNHDQFIIVAHSIGACVGLKVAENFKSELMGFVAVASVIPISGNSFACSLPLPQKLIMHIILKIFGTKPPQKSIETELCNDLTAEQTAKIVEEFTPESRSLYTTKIKYDLPDINRLYIKLNNDKSMPPSFQDQMAKNLNAERIIAIDSGHLPMIGQAKHFAEVLVTFSNEIVANGQIRNTE